MLPQTTSALTVYQLSANISRAPPKSTLASGVPKKAMLRRPPLSDSIMIFQNCVGAVGEFMLMRMTAS
jgi:hypothetical protein